jgi:hypothetical protein
MGTSTFTSFLLQFKFAPNANVAKLLKSGTATDAELAQAVKTTKQYKENKDLQTQVAVVIAKATEPVEVKKVAEQPKSTSTRAGEPRR